MRRLALEFASRGEMAIRDLGDPPRPGPTQILLETQYTGVTNGTERHALLTEHGYGGGRFPGRHGYQHVGVVAAVGAEVASYTIGDWVFFGGYVGHNGWNMVDEKSLLIKLPVEIDRRYCALFGVAGVALRSVRRLGVGQGDNVWVVGQGPIGLFTGQAARAAGARVTVSDMLDRRLEAARACGAHVALNALAEDTEGMLKEGRPYNYIYDCCSAEELLRGVQAGGLLAYGGTIGLTAVRDTVTYPWGVLHGTEARIETTCHFSADDLRVLLFLFQQGLIEVEPMVSHVVPIDEAPSIYDMLAHRGEDLLGVIFDWAP